MEDKLKEIAKLKIESLNNVFEPGKTRIPAAVKCFDEQELINGMKAILDCWWTEGEFNAKFITKFSEFTGLKHIVTVNSGSSANLLAFSALFSPLLKERAIKKGDEVITVASCFPTTIAPIVQYGCIPVFLDVDLETYNINIDMLEKAVSPKTKAIFLAHTLGNPFNLAKIKEICDKHNLWLIEDCCDALGSKYDNKMVGTFGDLCTYSFYPAHHITAGEGGAVGTNDKLLKKVLFSMRDWGRDCWCAPGTDNTCNKRFSWQLGQLPLGYDHKYIYSHLGYNLKWTDMQAAIALAQLDKLPNFIKSRKENFQKLSDKLKKFEDFLILPKAEINSDPSWFGYLLSVKENVDRTDLIKFLESKQIVTRLLFAGNIIKQPCFKGIEHRIVGNLENTDYVMNNTFWIGVHPKINDEIVDYIVNVFEEYFSNK